ncbi:MAG: hypothetical protein IJS83_06435 [Acholeplasmatales bacterium]|nr:hypothetical protein [Acholeplasmatales bacterium]
MENDNKELNNPEMPESIWADGIPENLQESDKINQEQLHAMAVDYITKNIILPKGFKIEPGFPRKDFPNIICKRDGTIYAIVVFPSVYPHFVAINDEFRLKVVDLCKKMEKDVNANKKDKNQPDSKIVPLFAPVGYKSIDEARANASIVLRGDVFKTSFPGFVVLTDAPHQDPAPVNNELFRP